MYVYAHPVRMYVVGVGIYVRTYVCWYTYVYTPYVQRYMLYKCTVPMGQNGMFKGCGMGVPASTKGEQPFSG